MITRPSPNSFFEMRLSEAGYVGSAHWTALYALDTACSLLGSRHAWVTGHAGESCKMVLRRDADMELDSELERLVEGSSKNTQEGNILTMPWRHGSLLFAGLPLGQVADGGRYVLGMLFEKPFEMTERRAGIMDGLRCSLQTYLSRLPYMPTVQPADKSAPVACCCCRRVHTEEHGWMYWDDLRLMTTGRGTSHTVCEKCAESLYSDVLQNDV